MSSIGTPKKRGGHKTHTQEFVNVTCKAGEGNVKPATPNRLMENELFGSYRFYLSMSLKSLIMARSSWCGKSSLQKKSNVCVRKGSTFKQEKSPMFHLLLVGKLLMLPASVSSLENKKTIPSKMVNIVRSK